MLSPLKPDPTTRGDHLRSARRDWLVLGTACAITAMAPIPALISFLFWVWAAGAVVGVVLTSLAISDTEQ